MSHYQHLSIEERESIAILFFDVQYILYIFFLVHLASMKGYTPKTLFLHVVLPIRFRSNYRLQVSRNTLLL